jgi:hypothetical protein
MGFDNGVLIAHHQVNQINNKRITLEGNSPFCFIAPSFLQRNRPAMMYAAHSSTPVSVIIIQFLKSTDKRLNQPLKCLLLNEVIHERKTIL